MAGPVGIAGDYLRPGTVAPYIRSQGAVRRWDCRHLGCGRSGYTAERRRHPRPAFAELFREKLEEAGYQGPTPTGYVLSFQLSGDKPKDARRSQFQLRGDGGSSSSSENVDLTMRWKATTDKTSPTRRARHLTVSLANAERNQIWQAKIVFKAADADDFTLVEAILPSLIANMGNTVYALRVP